MKRHHELSIRQHDIITGTLLGDGNLTKRYGNANCALRVGHNSKQREYVVWKHREFDGFSLPLKKECRRSTSLVKSDCEMYIFRTVANSEITALERIWYLRDKDDKYILSDSGRRIKTLPPDLSLSPLALSVWFFDDGTNLYRTQDKYPQRNLVLHSLGFSKEETERLSELVASCGFNCGVRANSPGWEVVIYASSFFDFLGMVKSNLDIPCMKYKCDLESYARPKVPNAKCEKRLKEIVSLRENGAKLSEIAELMGISISTVSNILTGRAWSGVTDIEYSPRKAKGVYRNDRSNKWIAWITQNGKKKYLGSFETQTAAISARRKAENEIGI